MNATLSSTFPQSTTRPARAATPAGFPVVVETPHGDVTVIARYDAAREAWTFSAPSHSHAGRWHRVSADGHCDCPATRRCWHQLAAARAATYARQIIWSALYHDLTLNASPDALWAAIDMLALMGIAARIDQRDEVRRAMEVL